MTDHDKAVRAAALEEAGEAIFRRLTPWLSSTLPDNRRTTSPIIREIRALADMPPGYVAVKRETWEAFEPFLNWAEDRIERHALEREDFDALQKFYDARAAFAEVLK